MILFSLDKMLTAQVLLLALLAPFACTTTLIPGPLTPTIKSPDAVQSKYRLSFVDNFDGDTLNKTVWRTTGEGKVGSGNGIYYKKNSNIRVAGGMLNLDCKRETFKNASGVEVTAYTVGRIYTHRTFNRGYFESRLKVPKAGGSSKYIYSDVHAV
jgi:beta-glucanase (GH16 family)